MGYRRSRARAERIGRREGCPSRFILVEASSDLANWSPLATNTLSGHPFPFTDPAPATLPLRFYRVQAQ